MLTNNQQKYIFQTSFDTVEEKKGPTPTEIAYANGLEEGKLQGHAEGFEEAMGSVEVQILNVLQTFRDELEQVYAQFDSLVESNTRYSVGLIEKIANKFFLKLPESQILETVIATLRETLPIVVDQRKLVLYVNPALVEELKKRMGADPDLTDLIRRLDIIGNDVFKDSECKLAWAKGSLEINPKDTWAQIETIIDNNQKNLKRIGKLRTSTESEPPATKSE